MMVDFIYLGAVGDEWSVLNMKLRRWTYLGRYGDLCS